MTDSEGFKLPARYSYIDKKRAVEVKDQGNYGTCWALQRRLLKHHMPEKNWIFF